VTLLVRPGGDARPGRFQLIAGHVEDLMTKGFRQLVIGCVFAILMTAVNLSAMGSAVAQSRGGQIGWDGLTNRHESPSSETEPPLRLDM
jgi:hypothetical protein